eukprot:scaffold1328_cov375-Pavlova_lutheri.AAC.22
MGTLPPQESRKIELTLYYKCRRRSARATKGRKIATWQVHEIGWLVECHDARRFELGIMHTSPIEQGGIACFDVAPTMSTGCKLPILSKCGFEYGVHPLSSQGLDTNVKSDFNPCLKSGSRKHSQTKFLARNPDRTALTFSFD